MNPLSTRIRPRRAPQQPLLDLLQTPSVPQRRSSRIQARQRSGLVQHVLGSSYESRSSLEQRQEDRQTSQCGAISLTRVPTPSPIEGSVPVPSRTQCQNYPCLPHTHNHQARKRRPDRSIETDVERPLKRARLTEKNLKAFEKMGGRERKSAGKKSTGQSSSTTTSADKDFGPQLERNHVVFGNLDARTADDYEDIRKLLNRRRESEPPDRLDYNQYLAATKGCQNEATIQYSAYPFLSKRTSREAMISGYRQSANYAWSDVDNHLTTGLSNAKPDIFESYRKTNYPPEVVDELSSALSPTSYDIAMPAFAVEVKGYNGSMQVAQLQCAYNGALMTEGAYAVHTHINKSNVEFCGTTQALTVGYNGENLNFYGHHTRQIPTPSDPVICESAGSGVVSTEATGKTAACLEYHQYLLSCDNPCASYEDFKKAYKHTRNAQDIGYKWATERKDALWALTNASSTQISPDVPVSSQQLQDDFVAPNSSATPSGHTPITLLQSSKGLTGQGHIARAADAIEGPREVVPISKAKTASKAPRYRDGRSDRRLHSER
ncbi:uncharacterized protein BP5553_07362 [Venustampulla echinocandica]|uniref:DUF7924 domain-containing protein n=1 Tax=Venustampulla echinocandica TaxID=2656787 RepID=A0A370TJ90_9HELO|nr:uncharacterized protein BP5553_07362 [Venustampulla echinocandica]RDL35431.1 hypothetical protein BP5553_07362 [Venustampulla echinocandica]